MASQKVVLVLSGGVALGAYQAGAYAVLHPHENLRPERLAGSSIGAINAAVIAGNPPERRIEQLQGFWNAVTVEPPLPVTAWMDLWGRSPARHVYSWLSVLQTRVLGRTGVFRPRLPELMLKEVPASMIWRRFERSLRTSSTLTG